MELGHHRALIEDMVFVTSATDANELKAVGLLVDSIRRFGGALSEAPVWLVLDSGFEGLPELPDDEGVEILETRVREEIRGYELAGKVSACAEAEKRAASAIRSLVWLSPDTLTVNPPTQFILDEAFDAALRPVHVKNIGLRADEPVDGFWEGIMDCAGISDTDFEVRSFVDGQRIRAYFNSHSYCVNPSIGLFQEWLRCFTNLVADDEYQEHHCSDGLHRTFLHQALLSTLTVAMIPRDRIRVLPPTYCYPYNLQSSIAVNHRATTLNQLTSVVYENLVLDPDEMKDIGMDEPLRSWLAERTGKNLKL